MTSLASQSPEKQLHQSALHNASGDTQTTGNVEQQQSSEPTSAGPLQLSSVILRMLYRHNMGVSPGQVIRTEPPFHCSANHFHGWGTPIDQHITNCADSRFTILRSITFPRIRMANMVGYKKGMDHKDVNSTGVWVL